jgi:hypothetical protein
MLLQVAAAVVAPSTATQPGSGQRAAAAAAASDTNQWLRGHDGRLIKHGAEGPTVAVSAAAAPADSDDSTSIPDHKLML